jgi:hypothetical protein
LEVSSVDLAEVRNQAAAMMAAEVAVVQAEEALAKAQAELARLSEKVLPELLEKVQLTKLTMEGGVELNIEDRVFASIRKGREQEAIAHLDATGHSAIVKREYKIDFGKENEKLAKKFARDLKRRKVPLNVTLKQTVHSSTLKVWARERLEKGESYPETAFSIHPSKVAKIKHPAGKKPKKV